MASSVHGNVAVAHRLVRQEWAACNGGPYLHPGSETVSPLVLGAAGNDAVVDRVLVELRDNSNPALVVASRAGLVQRDSDIVDTDGVSPLWVDHAWNSYLDHR